MVVPFAIVGSLLFCPWGDCGQDLDVLCTGLLTIVGMREGRHVGSDDVTRWQRPWAFADDIAFGDNFWDDVIDALRSMSDRSE